MNENEVNELNISRMLSMTRLPQFTSIFLPVKFQRSKVFGVKWASDATYNRPKVWLDSLFTIYTPYTTYVPYTPYIHHTYTIYTPYIHHTYIFTRFLTFLYACLT